MNRVTEKLPGRGRISTGPSIWHNILTNSEG